METLGIRLKKCRKARGDTQQVAAKAVGMSQTNLSELESDLYPTSSFIPMLANYYGVDALWLATGKAGKAQKNLSSFGLQVNTVASNIGGKIPLKGRVPLISYVAAGNWSEAVDNFSVGDSESWVNTTIPVRRHTFALRVQGDSMESKFPDGATIIVEPEEEAKNGSFVIVRQNGSEATFKQLIIDGGQKYLKPYNDRYPIMQMREDAVICGVVKQMVMDV